MFAKRSPTLHLRELLFKIFPVEGGDPLPYSPRTMHSARLNLSSRFAASFSRKPYLPTFWMESPTQKTIDNPAVLSC